MNDLSIAMGIRTPEQVHAGNPIWQFWGKVRELTPGHQSGVTDLVFHPDGKHLASTGRDTVVRIWNTADGKMLKELGKPRGGQFKDWFHAISFSADGRWLAAADMAGAVQVWSLVGPTT